ncbi:hypothetical protein PHMEG_00032783 [Phytophthora megakarya]|uniref:DDE Tnp4 domain-containing protein n=1 Tax=Phytophthora megakarya TaxID=4795 RepID=A0A225UUK6_9STRA|nr:hypothetical protein PHMEG_00032783 [Phytophthora megakarya]
MNPSYTVAHLVQVDEDRQAKRARCTPPTRAAASRDDEEGDSISPMYDRFVRNGGESIMQMTNFADGKLDRLCQVVKDFVVLRWNVRRGKKYGVEVRHNALAIPLRVFVEDANAKWGMRELVAAGKSFSNFRARSSIPYGLCDGRSIYYSDKHNLHDYKVEVSVLPTGTAINRTQHYPGHVSDIEVFRKNQAFHSQNLQTSEEDKHLQDDASLEAKYPDEASRRTSAFRAITPHKKQPGATLSNEQLDEIDRISHDRVLVDNYFGRLTSLWAVCSDKYRWAEGSYDILFKSCVALTNYHVHLNPMRAEDGDSYHNYLGRLLSIGKDAIAKRMLSQKRYRKRR